MTPLLRKILYDKTGVFKFAILTSPLFIIGLVIKLYASALFSSSYFGSLFVPFLKHYSLTSSDPYTHFFNSGVLEAFPYPQLMLFIMSLPGELLTPLLNQNLLTVTNGDLLLYHLPILAADITILLILARWLKNQHQLLLIFYWLSPILFYINYLHSQLDVIPIAFVFLFLHYLFKRQVLLAAAFLALGIATKFHLIILLPFTLVYLWRTYGIGRELLTTLLFVPGIFLAVNIGRLTSAPFIEMVFNNQEQFKVFDLAVPFGDVTALYVAPAAYIALFLHSLHFRRFNRDTFVMFLGFAFGILTLCIAPMPGWYYWVIPFFVYFLVKNQKTSPLLLWLLTLGYFAYFALVPKSDFISILTHTIPTLASVPNLHSVLLSYNLPAPLLTNIAFTFLQACLLVNVAWIYWRGVEESKKTKLYNMPYLLGIAGDSGSGKTTLTKLITDLFGSSEVATVEGDALHRWERGNEMWQTYTHLDPKANNLHDDLEHVLRLQSGDDTYRRHYDHHTGTFTSAERLQSKKLIVLEGLHSFYLTAMQDALDLKVFIMPEEQLRVHWKLLRDIQERGYSKERVLEQLEKRANDSAEYIASQEHYADVTFTLRNEVPLGDTIGTNTPLALYLEVRCNNAVNVDHLLSSLTTAGLHIEHRFVQRSQILRFRGEVTAVDIKQISFIHTPELYELTLDEPTWAGGYNGVMQIFLCYYIFASLRLARHHAPRL